MGDTVNLDRVGGTHVSGADIIDSANNAVKVNVVAGGAGGGAVTVADGADVTQGAKADAAWVSGDGTVVSLLKKIAGAGGSAVSIADGSDVAEGTTTDAAIVTDVAGTLSAKLRGLVKMFADVWDSVNHRFRVDGSGVTQPVSAASLPLPSGASTGAKQDTGNSALASIDGKIPASPSQEHTTAASPNSARLSDGVAFYKATTPADQQHTIVDSITAGSNVIGKVTTDQTTHGTSDLVAADITKVGGAAITEGQKAMAASIPVVLASDQASVPVAAQATATALQPAYSEGSQSNVTQTLSGRLRVDVELSDVQRRLLEQQQLIEYANLLENIVTSESENSQRMGFEVR